VLQAPSFRLEQYIQQYQKPSASPSDAASQLHTAVHSLRAALTSQQQLLVDMTAACRQYQDAVLSQSFSETALAAPAASDAAVTGQAASDPATAAALADAAEEAAGQSMGAAASVEHQPCPEEVALLMDAVTAGLQQDLEWMVRRMLHLGDADGCFWSAQHANRPEDCVRPSRSLRHFTTKECISSNFAKS
jgi:hypothetical protein